MGYKNTRRKWPAVATLEFSHWNTEKEEEEILEG